MELDKLERCPRCNSPSPERHPAMQFEGEVQPCTHPWHTPKPPPPPPPPPITTEQREVFDNLVEAARTEEGIALVSAFTKDGHKPVALVCAIRPNPTTKEYTIQPLALLLPLDNPTALFEDPTI